MMTVPPRFIFVSDLSVIHPHGHTHHTTAPFYVFGLSIGRDQFSFIQDHHKIDSAQKLKSLTGVFLRLACEVSLIFMLLFHLCISSGIVAWVLLPLLETPPYMGFMMLARKSKHHRKHEIQLVVLFIRT